MTGCTCDAARNVTVSEKLSIGSARRVDGKKDKCAGGEDGGRIVACGSQDDIVNCRESVTGRFI